MLLDAIRKGLGPAVTCRLVGINRATLKDWRDNDPEFELQYQQARAECEMWHLENINRAALEPKSWAASGWFLERSFPQRYAKKQPDVVVQQQSTQGLQLPDDQAARVAILQALLDREKGKAA